jgi:hypothetical protein
MLKHRCHLLQIYILRAIKECLCSFHCHCPRHLMSTGIQAMLATVQKYHDTPTLPPIRATIVAGNNDVAIRISDQGVHLIDLSGILFTIRPQAEVFLFPKSNHRPPCSLSRMSEMLRGWKTLGLGRCAL